MGPGGMEINNGSSNNIVMSSGGIRVYNGGSNVYSVDISSSNGIKINGRPVPSSNYYTPSSQSRYTGPTNNYSDYEEDEDEEEDDYSFEDENQDSRNFYSMGQNVYGYNNLNINNGMMPNYIDVDEEEMEEEIQYGLDPDKISSLPVMIYSSKMEIQAKMMKQKSTGPTSNNFCSICIVDYKNGDKLRCLPCFHRFHQKCIDEWLIIKNECPLCKSAIE